MSKKWITFLTDYGLENKFVGVCHGIIARIAPETRVLDVTHLIPRGNIAHGAEVFRQAIRYLPEGVHLAVVDPGVGTPRKAVTLLIGENLLIGPDNGLLMSAADELGGIEAAYEITNTKFHLGDVSATFHGRDVFSPVAAHLAVGVSPIEVGPPVDVGDLVRLPDPVRCVEGGILHGQVMIEDRFGNLQTSLNRALMRDAGINVGTELVLEAGGNTTVLPYVHTFGSVEEGHLLAHIDSANRLAIAVNLGSAASMLSMTEGCTFALAPRPTGHLSLPMRPRTRRLFS
jgi:S-adenosyl-L-methionine hydrolase (adenosine-forming)